MLVSFNWLKEHFAKVDNKVDPRDLADKLTMRGIHVAGIKRSNDSLANVNIGKIIQIEKHPNADKLRVTQVVFSEDEGAEKHQIVCGASNIAEGDIVPVALPGCVLPGDFAIKISTIRGVESRGMICSGKELGVSEDSEGILQLPKHAQLGQPLSKFLGTNAGSEDTIFEFELTPNRHDCMSVIGIAREAAPLLKTTLKEPKPAKFKAGAHRTSSIIKVEVDDPALCPRYIARVMDGLKIEKSPDWIKERLEAVGLKPINNIVDVTNYIMLEYGQPLHAFDLRRIESGSIRVGAAKEQRDFTLLSGDIVQIEPGDIIIWDGERPIALAGIMGGLNSQIEDSTTSIVLESAAFDPVQIRRTAKRLGLVTESSKRFEKASDLAAVAAASEKAAMILRDSMNANVYHPPIDTNEYGVKEHVLAVDMREVRKITGLPQLSAEHAADLLDSIGISSHKKSPNVLSVRLPSFRQDLKSTIDLVEEVARLNGYEHIPQNLPLSVATFDRLDESSFEFENRARHVLFNSGLREAINYSFISEELCQNFGFMGEDLVRLKNPLSEEMKVLRTSLLPGLLQNYLYNINRKATDLKLFEVGKTFFADSNEETKVKEVPKVAAVLSGHHLNPHWSGKSKEVDFYFAKGLAELLVKQLTTVYLSFEPINLPLLHPKRSALIKLGLKEVGFVGEVHPHIKDSLLETSEPLVVFELNLEVLRKYARSGVRYKTPSRFPGIDLDLAFMVDECVSAQSLVDGIKHAGGPLLSEVSVFDVYQGENIPTQKKSLAFRLHFLSPDRTLQESEVNTSKDNIIKSVSEKFQAQIRS
ncbi:MAG: phenylalanine--tRNA ligase subunit beta [Pseudomonadota bacterium]